MTRPRLAVVLQIALLVAVAWALWHRLAPQLASVHPADFARWHPGAMPVLVATVALAAVYLLQAFLWRRILTDVGGGAPDARTTVRVYFVSALARYIPGSVWQFAGLAVLASQAGIPPLAATAAGILGNLASLATGVVFVAFTMPVTGDVARILGIVAAVVVVAAGWVVFAGSRARAWVLRWTPRRIVPALELAGRIRPAHALVWTLGLGACWLLYAAAFVLFVAAFVQGAEVHARYLGGVVAFSFLAGYVVPVAPAGAGVRELVMVPALAAVIPLPAALVVAVAARVWTIVAELLALASFIFLPGRRSEQGRPDKLTEDL